MKSCFNIFRGFIAAILFLVYFVVLIVSFILLPFTSILKDANSFNKTIDGAELEVRIAELLTTNASSLMGTEMPAEEMPDIDLSEALDEEMIGKLVTLRRNVINTVYSAFENNQVLSYEVDIQFLNDLYMDVLTQMTADQLSEIDVCDYWMDPTLPLDMNSTCLPPHFAIANGIDIPDSVIVPEGFKVTDDMKIESILESSEDFELEKIENPVIEMDQDTVYGFHILLILLKIYIYVFIGLSIVLFLLYLLISPAKKAAIIAIGILHIVTSIIAAILWNAPQILIRLSPNLTMFSDILVPLVNEVAKIALITALCIGIIGLLLIILAIFLPKKKKDEEQEKPKEETKQQSAGKDNSSK